MSLPADPNLTETIFALSTGSLPAAIAIIRISGPKTADILTQITQRELPPARSAHKRLLYRAGYNSGSLNDLAAKILDEALVLWFPNPASFTGEDMAELQVHGSRAIVEILIKELQQFPETRLAEAGEFTKRAFQHGKLDLTAVEGLADLIAAETEAQRRQALRQYQGELGKLYEIWRHALVHLAAYLEAYIDFPDEELPAELNHMVKQRLADLQTQIKSHLADGNRGQRIRQGLMLTIVGPPNAGKSSLINWLSRRDVAIVSPIAGTTRDIVETTLNIGGVPVTIADTAGLRPTTDSIEEEGVRRARQHALASDIQLLMVSAQDWPKIPGDILELVTSETIFLVNKIDLSSPVPIAAAPNTFFISLQTGAGLADFMGFLKQKIEKMVGTAIGSAPLITRHRHRQALEKCLLSLEQADMTVSIELMAEDLRLAIRALGEITGRVHIEEMLDVIFREFCIGK